jgi:hypothetical protein
MFSIDHDAQEYIRNQSGAVIISFTFEPSMGGCPCSGKNVNGSYVPGITVGIPLDEDMDKYQISLVEDIRIFHPEQVTVKVGFPAIHIKLRTMLLFKWLEIEGATAITFAAKSGGE